MSDAPHLVLVVDDEPLLQLLGVDIAQEAGFAALQAGSADEALLILEARSDIAVVFTDIAMRGSMDGLGLARLIGERWPDLRIIVSSGRGAPREDQLPAGCVFLEKPFDPDDLAAMIAQLMPRR
jgi:CheY-like chemotaxis protein